jgi:hypothetical protein
LLPETIGEPASTTRSTRFGRPSAGYPDAISSNRRSARATAIAPSPTAPPDPLRGPVARVAGDEQAGNARLQSERVAVERPVIGAGAVV